VPTVYDHSTAIRTLVAGPVADTRTKVVEPESASRLPGPRQRWPWSWSWSWPWPWPSLITHSPTPLRPRPPLRPLSSPYSTVTLFARLRG
jgi:hypothetical protein